MKLWVPKPTPETELFNEAQQMMYDDNIEMFKEIREIDGFLVGGASKSSKKFIDIIKNYYR